jgi:hypothetical protein
VVPGGVHSHVATRQGFLATAQVLLMALMVREYRPLPRAWWVELRSELVPFYLALAGGKKWLENWELMIVDFERKLFLIRNVYCMFE